MSDATLRTDGSLEAQPKMGVRARRCAISCPQPARSPKFFHAQSAAFHDALERADGNRFVAVHRHDHLPAIGMPPFLMTAFLAHLQEPVLAENPNHFLGVANREAFTHGSATCSTLAPAGSARGEGSNHSSSASFALLTASSSVSPAEAQPGSSGKKAAHRLLSGSCSTTSRSFMPVKITRRNLPRKFIFLICRHDRLHLPVLGEKALPNRALDNDLTP